MLWLSRKDIEHISRRLLRDYLKKVPQKVDHIDPTDFAEKMCGLQFTFADISEFEAICEIEEKKAGYNPELSYGSHIFQDLVEAEILYTAVFANEKTLRFAPEKLAEYPDIVSLFTEDPELKQVVHVYDMSKVSCELCNDLQNERLILYQQ